MYELIFYWIFSAYCWVHKIDMRVLRGLMAGEPGSGRYGSL